MSETKGNVLSLRQSVSAASKLALLLPVSNQTRDIRWDALKSEALVTLARTLCLP